jgi:hypothetical protein
MSREPPFLNVAASPENFYNLQIEVFTQVVERLQCVESKAQCGKLLLFSIYPHMATYVVRSKEFPKYINKNYYVLPRSYSALSHSK